MLWLRVLGLVLAAPEAVASASQHDPDADPDAAPDADTRAVRGVAAARLDGAFGPLEGHVGDADAAARDLDKAPSWASLSRQVKMILGLASGRVTGDLRNLAEKARAVLAAAGTPLPSDKSLRASDVVATFRAEINKACFRAGAHPVPFGPDVHMFLHRVLEHLAQAETDEEATAHGPEASVRRDPASLVETAAKAEPSWLGAVLFPAVLATTLFPFFVFLMGLYALVHIVVGIAISPVITAYLALEAVRGLQTGVYSLAVAGVTHACGALEHVPSLPWPVALAARPVAGVVRRIVDATGHAPLVDDTLGTLIQLCDLLTGTDLSTPQGLGRALLQPSDDDRYARFGDVRGEFARGPGLFAALHAFRVTRGPDFLKSWDSRLSVSFVGEIGQDAGGLRRDLWFEAVRGGAAFLARDSTGRLTYKLPTPLLDVTTGAATQAAMDLHLPELEFLGELVAAGLVEQDAAYLNPLRMSDGVYAGLAGTVPVPDGPAPSCERLDQYATGGASWFYSPTSFGGERMYKLVPESIAWGDLREGDEEVTAETADACAEAICADLWNRYVAPQAAAFEAGFERIAQIRQAAPRALAAAQQPGRLREILEGQLTVDTSRFLGGVSYGDRRYGASPSASQRRVFEEAVRGLDASDVSMLLEFVTGASTLPATGDLIFLVTVSRRDECRVLSHTCFNQLEVHAPCFEDAQLFRTVLHETLVVFRDYRAFDLA